MTPKCQDLIFMWTTTTTTKTIALPRTQGNNHYIKIIVVCPYVCPSVSNGRSVETI